MLGGRKSTGPAYGHAGGSSPGQQGKQEQRQQDNNNFIIKRRNKQIEKQLHPDGNNLISLNQPKLSLIDYKDNSQWSDSDSDWKAAGDHESGYNRFQPNLFGGDQVREEESREFLDKKHDSTSQFKNRKNKSTSPTPKSSPSRSFQAKLARQETALIDEEDTETRPSCACRMIKLLKQKRFWLPILLIIIYTVAVYSVPFVEFEPKTTAEWPHIPFNFREGPLKPSSASQFKVDHLFKDQIHGAESLAIDSMGNMYLAIEGGFVLYAHLNKSSPIKSHYYLDSAQNQPPLDAFDLPNLVKIAELNGIKQFNPKRSQRDATTTTTTTATTTNNNNGNQDNVKSPVWRRECQLDEQIYGNQLYTPTSSQLQQQQSSQAQQQPHRSTKNHIYPNFVSHVPLSRCSKPLGIRLSPDENYLYIVDTLTGLYRVNLKQPERRYSSQRSVTRLIDFRHHQLVAVEDSQEAGQTNRIMNISMKAIDDLVVVSGNGLRPADVIYLTVASQNWPAVSFVYDKLEGRPSGLIVKYDTATNQLTAIDPNRVAHVRTSTFDMIPDDYDHVANQNSSNSVMSYNFGVPKMDENDVFDDRPLHFPNGIEVTDNKDALLIAETANKRIIKYFINGPRRGTSDLWAWTPQLPDNIRRGFGKRSETYWVVGCGRDESRGYHFDPFSVLNHWPTFRKFIVKNVYLFGMFVEWMGTNLIKSVNVRDFGYSIRTGSSLCENGCVGMMIVQYNHNGDIVRSIHSREFPQDLFYYSQVNEVIDAINQEHVLYLGSPSYRYVTKITLPADVLLSSARPMT